MPRYAANVEGGGGKILLMPSGHDTLNRGNHLEKKISESFADISTWDGRKLYKYEALGRSTAEEFENAVNIMDAFIGRKGVFLPKVIIVDEHGNHLNTTNRTKLPSIKKIRKSELLNYEVFEEDMPLTNPADIADKLDVLFAGSDYCK